MALTVLGHSRIGGVPSCSRCRVGEVESLNWRYHRDSDKAEDRERLDAFTLAGRLRRGELWRCTTCGSAWYLDSQREMMTLVSDTRLALVREWSRQPIVLSDEILGRLREIGRTPADIYGNGRQYEETPCGVVTRSGERIDLAVVSLQREAPIESWRTVRLGTEIVDVYPSPHALPLDIRVATSRAEEGPMGFAPTRIEVPDGRLLILN